MSLFHQLEQRSSGWGAHEGLAKHTEWIRYSRIAAIRRPQKVGSGGWRHRLQRCRNWTLDAFEVKLHPCCPARKPSPARVPNRPL